jgi:hypothetical protein
MFKLNSKKSFTGGKGKNPARISMSSIERVPTVLLIEILQFVNFFDVQSIKQVGPSFYKVLSVKINQLRLKVAFFLKIKAFAITFDVTRTYWRHDHELYALAKTFPYVQKFDPFSHVPHRTKIYLNQVCGWLTVSENKIIFASQLKQNFVEYTNHSERKSIFNRQWRAHGYDLAIAGPNEIVMTEGEPRGNTSVAYLKFFTFTGEPLHQYTVSLYGMREKISSAEASCLHSVHLHYWGDRWMIVNFVNGCVMTGKLKELHYFTWWLRVAKSPLYITFEQESLISLVYRYQLSAWEFEQYTFLGDLIAKSIIPTASGRQGGLKTIAFRNSHLCLFYSKMVEVWCWKQK